MGFLTDRHLPYPSWYGEKAEHRAVLGGTFVGVQKQVHLRDNGSEYTTESMVFDFGAHPATGERVIGQFPSSRSWSHYVVMRTLDLDADHLMPPWDSDWSDPALVRLDRSFSERDSPPLIVGEVYPVELRIGFDPPWTCQDEAAGSAADLSEWCEEAVAERLANGEPAWPALAYNASLVAALAGDIPHPPTRDSSEAASLWMSPAVWVEVIYLPLGTLEQAMVEQGPRPGWFVATELASGPDPATFSASDELREAWQRWQTAGIDSYSYVVRVTSPGDDPMVGLVFADEDRIIVVPTDSGPYPRPFVEIAGPIEQMFTLIESRSSGLLTVEYDANDGHPIRLERTQQGPWIVEILDLQTP